MNPTGSITATGCSINGFNGNFGYYPAFDAYTNSTFMTTYEYKYSRVGGVWKALYSDSSGGFITYTRFTGGVDVTNEYSGAGTPPVVVYTPTVVTNTASEVTSKAYSSLPTNGVTSIVYSNPSAFATAAQGALADSALSTNGSGIALTSLDLNPSLTDTVALAAAALQEVTAADVVAAGGVTNVVIDGQTASLAAGTATANIGGIFTPADLLPLVVDGTGTFTRAMVLTNASWRIAPTGTVYFTADSTLTDTNLEAVVSMNVFYGAQTFGWVNATMTNASTLTSNAWNGIIFTKPYGSSVFTGR
jgi:hypothetical protein